MLTRLFFRLLHGAQLVLRSLWSPVCLGALGALFDGQGRVLLVRHRYRPGWHLPGGGVGRGEPTDAAALRELAEEVGLQDGRAEFFALYTRRVGPVSHLVALYRVTGRIAFRPSLEIAEIVFADPAAPPPGASPATLRRLRELSGHAAISPYW
jgi:8-oxo-dGTP pyrophosphatase MutT (NUDIX family)